MVNARIILLFFVESLNSNAMNSKWNRLNGNDLPPKTIIRLESNEIYLSGYLPDMLPNCWLVDEAAAAAPSHACEFCKILACKWNEKRTKIKNRLISFIGVIATKKWKSVKWSQRLPKNIKATWCIWHINTIEFKQRIWKPCTECRHFADRLRSAMKINFEVVTDSDPHTTSHGDHDQPSSFLSTQTSPLSKIVWRSQHQ